MTDYKMALQKTLNYEGGYVFDKDDPGGETYKGVSRNANPTWDGWTTIDLLRKQNGFPANLDKNSALQDLITSFYKTRYWDAIRGDQLADQHVAESIFDFAVNAGVATSSILAQLVVGAEQDGVIGPDTLKRINDSDPGHFIASFTVAKIARYVSIIKKRPLSQKYLYGWVRRALGDV
jgi:lysozyme family protein